MVRRHTDEIEPGHDGLDGPVSVLWGQGDAWIPPEKGVTLVAVIADHARLPIPDAGHLLQEDRPEAIIAAVLARLRDDQP